jgi:hypothetical protein
MENCSMGIKKQSLTQFIYNVTDWEQILGVLKSQNGYQKDLY